MADQGVVSSGKGNADMKRQCGDCQLCCKLLPVPPLNKLAGVKCEFQKFHKGCTVYHKPQMPTACRVWHCRWLVNDDADDLSRPDRSHYVIDMLPDEIAVVDNGTGARQAMVAIQIWADPAFPDAWKDDRALIAWILKKAEGGFPTLIRHSSRDALGVIAPPLSNDGEWHLGAGTINPNMGLWK